MLKSKLFLLVMAFFFLVAFSSLQAAVVIVDNTGGPLVYTTIQAGINAASPGDSIHVRLGTGAAYAGAIVNQNGLRIGAQYSVRVDDGLPTTFGVHGFVITANGCFISGFEIFGFDHGIDIPVWSGASGNTIYNNYIHNNNFGVAIDFPAPPAAYAEFGNMVLSNCFFRQTNKQPVSSQCWDGNLAGPPTQTIWSGNSYDDWSGAWVYPIAPIPPLNAFDPAPVGLFTYVQANPAVSNVGYNTFFDVFVEYVPPSGCKYTPVKLMSIEYRITYNPAILSVTNVVNAPGGLIPDPTGGQTIPNWDTAGVIRVAQTFLGGGGAPGPGDLVRITFRGIALGASTIDITVLNCLDTSSTPIVTFDGDGTANISDIVPPVITLILPASGGTYGPAGIAFTDVEATDDIGLWRMEWEFDGGGWNPYGAQPFPYPTFFDFAAATNAVFTVPWFNGLPDGLHTIRLIAQDASAGNYSAPSTWTFTVDLTPPSFTSVALADIVNEPAEPGWSNQLGVQMTIVAGGDATQMYLTGDITSPTPATWIPFAAVSTVTLIAGDGAKTVNVYVRDVYTNQVGPLSASIWLDTTAPTLTGFVLDGGAIYNTTGTASGDFQGNGTNPNWDFFQYRLTGGLSAPTGWTAAVDPVSITLSALDGAKTINAQIRDRAGNTSPIQSDGIILDTSAPSATITLRSNASATIPPYSTAYTPTNPVSCEIAATGSPAWMRLANEGGFITGVIAFATPVDAALTWVSGPRTITVELWDAASNYSGPLVDAITVDVTPPAAPVSFSALPGGSVELSWTNAAQVAVTRILTNPWNDYPEYIAAPPPYPPTKDSPFLVANVSAPGQTYSYNAPHKDIYYFSAFACDSAGNWSGAANVRGTSYFLGDIVEGGSVNFGDVEFFSDHYNTVQPGANFDAGCDFYPVVFDILTPGGVPVPDNKTDFDDLVVLAMNYGSGTVKIIPVYPSGPIVLNLNIGDKVSVGDVFEAKLTINDASSVKAMHLILDYDNSVLKLLGVTKGELSADPSIFFWADKEKVDISLAKLGQGLVIGGSGEVATLKFKMLSQGTTELTSNLLDVRDVNGKPIEVSFNKVNLAAVPIAFALSQNYPNPFNPKTQISFALPLASKVTLKIYNITGQLVKTLVDAELPAGHHTVTWSGTNSSGSEVGTGIYFYRLQTENFTSVKKMVLMK
ncbi:MAG: cohesin domain-containing protein [candidate division Zixibacteria bacterium]|nr:cohesin domain-containing protein [candidate division Zixibacteria bacterium]